MATISKERQGEIALTIIKDGIRKRGIELDGDKNRDVNAEAQRIGVKPEELLQFRETLYRELFEEAFPEK